MPPMNAPRGRIIVEVMARTMHGHLHLSAAESSLRTRAIRLALDTAPLESETLKIVVLEYQEQTPTPGARRVTA